MADRESARYFLGIDGGATKTKCVVCDVEGHALGSALAGPSNHHVVGFEAAKASIGEAIRGAIQVAGVTGSRIAAIGLGMAGIDSPADVTLVERMVRELSFVCRVVPVHDGMAALSGATGGRPGVVVIAGTGTLAFGLNATGDTCRASGWGYLLGDEGSGYDIGRRGMIAALWAYDGRGPDTLLLTRLREHFHLRTMRDLVNRVYGEKMPPQEFAAFAQVVAETAATGDGVATQILRQAGELLALSALAVLRRLQMEQAEVEVAVAGSVLEQNALVRRSFEETLYKAAPRARVISPRHEPAVGAALLAIKAYMAEQTEQKKGAKNAQNQDYRWQCHR